MRLPWLHVLDDVDDETEETEGEMDAADGSSISTTATTAAKMNQPLHLSSKLRRFTGMSNLKRTALNVIANQLTEADIGRYHLFGFVFGRKKGGTGGQYGAW